MSNLLHLQYQALIFLWWESNLQPVQLIKKGSKKGVPYTNTIDYEENQWNEIEKLNLTSLGQMCRAHGFPFKNAGIDGTKKERKERLLNILKKHLRSIHGWTVWRSNTDMDIFYAVLWKCWILDLSMNVMKIVPYMHILPAIYNENIRNRQNILAM